MKRQRAAHGYDKEVAAATRKVNDSPHLVDLIMALSEDDDDDDDDGYRQLTESEEERLRSETRRVHAEFRAHRAMNRLTVGEREFLKRETRRVHAEIRALTVSRPKFEPN